MYNIGNGGIVGCVGWYAKEADLKTTFTNITVDNSNKISALWGSYDVACGGIVGQYYPTSGQTSAGTPKNGGVHFENCHISAQMDVYNDVCANYQYYAYRYTGMLIGSVRENVEQNGHVYPKMDGITAENCTVHFGDWNDYYYCELVANSLASYTHDHQMSRLEQVASVDVENKTVTSLKGETTAIPTSGRYNYVVVKAKDANGMWIHGDGANYATCYHFVNGMQHKHDVADADNPEIYETVNGDEGVLKEDKQLVYREFNNLVTGYGWGVTSRGLSNLDGVTNLDITHREDVELTKKFDKNEALSGEFTYRVGNKNAFPIGKLFQEVSEGIAIDSGVYVSVTSMVEGVNMVGTFVKNESDWTQSALHITGGTGLAKLTIQDYNYCESFELIVEVVDAVNATSATNATENNVVLLQNCGFSSVEVSGGYTLYGNGFTMTCSSDSAASDMGYAFVKLNNGTLDNVQIVCPNFDYAALYKSNLTSSDNRSYTDNGTTRYYNAKSGVMASGNSQILNSRISGARAAVNASGGNLVIDNSRIELGAVASILVGAANSVTLRDVTLLQKPTASTYDSSKTLMGFSVLMICNSDGNAAPVTLEGTLVQNAWVDESDSQYVPSAGQSIISGVLSNETYTHDLDGDGKRESLNLGFAYMPESLTSKVNTTTIIDNRTNKAAVPYDYATVSIGNGNTYVYSYKYAENEVIPEEYENDTGYVSTNQGDTIAVSYSDTTEGLTTGKSYGTDGWVYELNVDLDKASGYKLDFSKLSMSVNGVAVTDFKVNGNVKPTSPVAVTAGGTTYTLTATVDGKEYTALFKVTGTEAAKDSPSLVASNYEAALLVGEAGSTFSKDTWHGAAPALEGVQIKYWSVAEKQYKTITLSEYTPTTAGKQNGTNNTWTYSPDNGDFTLTITGGQVHQSNQVDAMPVVCNNNLYFVAAASNGLVNYGNGARTIPVSYSFKDNNGGTELTFSHTWSIECADGNTAYDYSDFCNGTSKTFTIKSSNGDGCVTPDTLVTLADGTQKRIDQVTDTDQLLVWNFFKGEYVAVPSAIIFDHGYDNNTVIELKFSDGTAVKVVNLHQFFDASLNRFVSIDASSVADYVGHNFAKQSGSGCSTVTLVDYTITQEYCEAWGIISAQYYNILVEGMLSTDFMKEDYPLFNHLEFGQDMKFDEQQMQADIEKYGLYTYDDFAQYLTPEQFAAFNVPYFKIPVGKGEYTYEGILALIDTYLNN